MRIARSRLVSAFLVFAMMVVSSPVDAARDKGGIAPLSTVGVSASPNPYDPTSGQTLTVSWSYETTSHPTLITVSGPVSNTYPTSGGVGDNTFSFGSPQWPDGYYTITVVRTMSGAAIPGRPG